MGKNKASGSYETEVQDHITELRNEVLHLIQKFLPIKKAVQLSELSTRFKNIWKTCPYLTLNSNSVLGQESNSLSLSNKLYPPDFMQKRAEIFVQKVNKIIQHHYGQGLELFDVNFTLNSLHSNSIDKWVKFAIDSDTKELTLNLREGLVLEKPYKFPHRYFNSTGTSGKRFYLKNLTLVACSFRVPENCSGLSSIETLDLSWVKFSDTDLKNIISICTKLRWLRLKYCTGLVNLEISHSSDKLNYIRVDCDRDLESIHIHDCTGLSTFEYSVYNGYDNDDLEINLLRVPKLSRVSAFLDEVGPRFSVENLLNGPLSSLNGSLEKLFLLFKAPEVTNMPCLIDSFDNLKNLVLNIMAPRSESLLWLIPFLRATPFVEKIHFEIQPTGKTQKKPQKIQIEDYLLIFLRSVKIGGFKTDPKQIELIMYLVKNAPNLESLIIDTRWHCYLGNSKWEKIKMTNEQEQLNDARAKAEKVISGKIPSHVALKVF